MEAFHADKEVEMIGKMCSALKYYFENRKSQHKKFKPVLNAFRLFVKNKYLYVTRFDKGNGIEIDKKR